MDEKTAKEIKQARLLCGYARQFCVVGAVLIALLTVGSAAAIFGGHAGPELAIDVGPFGIRGDLPIMPAARVWAMLVMLTTLVVVCLGLRLMYLLFANLQHGAIFTQANVRLLRNLALVSMTGSILHGLIPMLSGLLVQWQVLEPVREATQDGSALGIHNMPGSFVTALLLWLASWIMDVGRRTRDEAEAMRRDADLVI
jgi:hypothetical protein